MIRVLCVLLVALLSGCVMGIPDADPPVKPVKPCEKIVIIQPNNTAVCMTREEFNRYLDKLLRNCPPQCSHE